MSKIYANGAKYTFMHDRGQVAMRAIAASLTILHAQNISANHATQHSYSHGAFEMVDKSKLSCWGSANLSQLALCMIIRVACEITVHIYKATTTLHASFLHNLNNISLGLI